MIVTPGDRKWPQTAEQGGNKIRAKLSRSVLKKHTEHRNVGRCLYYNRGKFGMYENLACIIRYSGYSGREKTIVIIGIDGGHRRRVRKGIA